MKGGTLAVSRFRIFLNEESNRPIHPKHETDKIVLDSTEGGVTLVLEMPGDGAGQRSNGECRTGTPSGTIEMVTPQAWYEIVGELVRCRF